MTRRVSPNFSVPETGQIGKIPPGIERSRPQDVKSGLKYKHKFFLFLSYLVRLAPLGVPIGARAPHGGT